MSMYHRVDVSAPAEAEAAARYSAQLPQYIDQPPRTVPIVKLSDALPIGQPLQAYPERIEVAGTAQVPGVGNRAIHVA